MTKSCIKYLRIFAFVSHQKRGSVRQNESRQSAQYSRQEAETIYWPRLHLSSARLVSAAVAEAGIKERDRSKRTWQDTLCDDFQMMNGSQVCG